MNLDHSIYHDLIIKATPQQVYRAVSQPNHINNWWTLRCSGEPALGSEYNFYFSEEHDWFGEVTNAAEFQSFHIKMTRTDPDWEPTSFGFDIEPHKEGVLLRFWHVGWPANNHHFRRSSYIWARLLTGLTNYIEKGIVLPFEERE